MRREGLLAIFLVALSVGFIGCSNAPETKQEARSVVEAKKADWQESSLFKSGDYTMIGQEGRLGFIYDDSEITRFYPDKVQKYMWHFWGEEEELKGELLIRASHESGGKPITLIEERILGGTNNEADVHVPTNMSLPMSGMWQMDVYINDTLFGTVFVKVYEKKGRQTV